MLFESFVEIKIEITSRFISLLYTFSKKMFHQNLIFRLYFHCFPLHNPIININLNFSFILNYNSYMEIYRKLQKPKLKKLRGRKIVTVISKIVKDPSV